MKTALVFPVFFPYTDVSSSINLKSSYLIFLPYLFIGALSSQGLCAPDSSFLSKLT